MAGHIDKAKGRAKEAIGKAIGNPRLEREGKRDQAVGTVKEKASKLKRAVEDKIDEKLDEVEDGDDRGRDRPNG
jgi:uncharacterized protein YjbJ (UPF0337 family)